MVGLESADKETGVGETAVSADRVEVRLLGTLTVRRANGALVTPREWRTGKTADLLRLLALSNGEVVPVGILVDALWPDVDPQRARASLRTAMCHLRKVLGPERIERRNNGLRLVGAWSDSSAFQELVKEVDRHRRSSQHASCVRAVREADSLYVGDLQAHHDDATWVGEWREQLRLEHLEALTDGAEAAVELAWMRDAVDFAGRVVEHSYCNERAYRALIAAHAGLGETDRALTAYERCRTLLADELGADPAPQTQALHLQVLRAEPVPVPDAAWHGRESEVQWLANALQTMAASGRSALLRLTGPRGCGRRRLVDEACRRAGIRMLESSGALASDDLLGQLNGAEPATVVVTEAGASSAALDALLRRLLERTPTAVVLVGAAAAASGLADDLAATVMCLDVQPLTVAETGELAAKFLGGPVTPQLTAELAAVAQGNLGSAVDTLREWGAEGRLAATPAGLVLISTDHDADPEAVETALPLLVGQLSLDELDVLGVVALLETPLSPNALADLLVAAPTTPAHLDGVERAVDHLSDLGVVVTVEQGVALRDPTLRYAVEAWLRPAVRRRLHSRIAEQARIPHTERVRHWAAAGESERACAAALDAAEQAAAEARWSDAHDHLQMVERLIDPEAGPEDRLELNERLGDCAAALGRRQEAHDAYLAAAEVAADHELSGQVRILGKLDSVSNVVIPRQRSVEVSTSRESRPTGRAGVRRDWRGALQEVEIVHLPRRGFDEARRTAFAAAAGATDPVLRARAVLLAALPDVLLGDARAATEELRVELSDPSLERADRHVTRALDAVARLGEHDRGAPGVATGTGLDGDVDEWSWVDVRVLTERGDLAAAAWLEARLPLPVDRPLTRHLGLLASAELRLAAGERNAAQTALGSMLDEALRDGYTLLVPLVTARLVCLVAADDRPAAKEYFELLDLVTGSTGDLPRERIWRQLARASVRSANDQPADAAASCAIAARVAEDIGALPLAARAHLRRAHHLREAGAYVESRIAAGEAHRLRQQCGLAVVEDPVADVETPRTNGRARLRIASVTGAVPVASGGLNGPVAVADLS